MLKHLVGYATAGLLVFATSSMSFAQSGGADLYKAKCQMCHAADGSGNTPAGKAMMAVPFDSPDILKEPDTTVSAVIKNGRGKMPAFTGKLTDAQITDLVAYIHTLQKK